MPNPPKLTCMIGLTGAGKTTLARKIAKETQQNLYALDEWMKSLFWPDAGPSSDLNWALERCDRCLNQIEKMVTQELLNGRGCVLDLGFTKAKDRQRWIQFAQDKGAALEFVFLDIPQSVRWSRVEKRNQNLGTADIQVDRATFDWMESYFEPLTASELPWVKRVTE